MLSMETLSRGNARGLPPDNGEMDGKLMSEPDRARKVPGDERLRLGGTKFLWNVSPRGNGLEV